MVTWRPVRPSSRLGSSVISFPFSTQRTWPFPIDRLANSPCSDQWQSRSEVLYSDHVPLYINSSTHHAAVSLSAPTVGVAYAAEPWHRLLARTPLTYALPG